MPIEFPLPIRVADWRLPENLFQVPVNYDATNLAFIGEAFTLESMTKRIAGLAQKGAANNMRNLGAQYEAVSTASMVNPVPAPTVDQAFSALQLGWGKAALVGVTRDSAGAILGLCDVYVFKDVLQEYVGTVQSDASGNWTFYTTVSGPFWVRCYKAASLAGTSDNGLLPDAV